MDKSRQDWAQAQGYNFTAEGALIPAHERIFAMDSADWEISIPLDAQPKTFDYGWSGTP